MTTAFKAERRQESRTSERARISGLWRALSSSRLSSRQRTQNVLIPPIRTFSTREAPLHASKTNLGQENDDELKLQTYATTTADTTPTISEAIARLENILEEACRLAQTVNDVDRHTPSPVRGERSQRQRTSDAIKKKGLTYLENADKKVTFVTDHAQEGQGSNKFKAGVKACIRKHSAYPVGPRTSSREQDTLPQEASSTALPKMMLNDEALPQEDDADDKGPPSKHALQLLYPGKPQHENSFSRIFGVKSRHASVDKSYSSSTGGRPIDLKHASHVDIWNKSEHFDVFDTCSHAPVARDWPIVRKRFTAAVVCINTVCVGMLIGIYAGEVPAIQYTIADFQHRTILGNVFLYCGLAVSTLISWPLPLLHGRKTYTVLGLAMTFGLQIPQGLAVTSFRDPGQMYWRVLLLLPRALSGLTLGLVNINLQMTMLDLFGSSLQSKHPHGEIADEFDVRRHGGGMGLWIAAWSWSSIGSIGFGFVVGTFIIENASVDWGFWTCLMLLMFIMILNVVTPEVRRSAFRRTVADLINQDGAFSRVARGEIKMHLEGSGPLWWGEEVQAGLHLCWLMVKQPGFLVLATYAAWVYAQFTLIMMLLGALSSRTYHLRPVYVGLCTISLVAGSLLAIPFQNASFFSRSRSHPARTDSMTFRKSVVWSSHLVRRGLFMVLLPLAAIAYALTSWGPPLPVAVPCILSAIVACFCNLAIAECNGLIMETFDTSDLQQGMTGRPARNSVVERSGVSERISHATLESVQDLRSHRVYHSFSLQQLQVSADGLTVN